jgi:hypothetical protein
MWNRLFVLVAAGLLVLTASQTFGQSSDPTSSSDPSATSVAIQPTPPEQSQTEKDRLAVNPVTGQTTAYSSNYTPLTLDERLKLYYKQSFWSVGAYFGPLFAALALDQAEGSPKQWGGGFRGYGRRVASRVASGDIVQNGIQFPAAYLLKEDVRYIASSQHGFGRRLEHAVLYSVLTYNPQGQPTLNVSNIGGYYGAAAISTLWLPGHQKVVSYTLSNGSESLLLSVPVNMLQEFWPEVRRDVFRRH